MISSLLEIRIYYKTSNFLGYGGGGGGGGGARWSTSDGQQRNDRWDRSGSGGGDRGQNFYNGAGQGGGNTRWQEPPSGKEFYRTCNVAGDILLSLLYGFLWDTSTFVPVI